MEGVNRVGWIVLRVVGVNESGDGGSRGQWSRVMGVKGSGVKGIV